MLHHIQEGQIFRCYTTSKWDTYSDITPYPRGTNIQMLHHIQVGLIYRKLSPVNFMILADIYSDITIICDRKRNSPYVFVCYNDIHVSDFTSPL